MDPILSGVNYFAGWWKPLPNKWHRHADSFATEQGSDWRPDFPERVPLLGEFNCQETMDRELEAASAYGVDFLPILWYYNEPNQEREPNSRFLNRVFDEFVDSPMADRINFFMEFCNHPPFEVTTNQQWQECLDSWEKYITHPSYLKVGGRAVFKVHGAQYFIEQNGVDISRCVKQLDSIRELFRQHGMDAIIGAGVMAADHVAAGNPIAKVFDFTCTYMDLPDLVRTEEDYPYELLGEHCRMARRVHSKDAIPYMPYLPAGWSPRPWPETRPFFAFPNRDEWRRELELMKQDLLTMPNLGLPLRNGSVQPAFNCYAWNEFGEGGIVAPTHITEYMKLEELQCVFKPETVRKKTERALHPA
ncbi:MAG: hypothetical protein HN341_06210 [Verrucomicrobia bacterium]|nr:hypothetical protein [Verrucomicrobiota bacterium]